MAMAIAGATICACMHPHGASGSQAFRPSVNDLFDRHYYVAEAKHANGAAECFDKCKIG
jgi:hypothetical protein